MDDPFFSARMIRYPRLQALYEDIEECCELTRDTFEPHCMALEGRTGAGKSWLVKDFARRFPRSDGESGSQVPVFYAQMPSPATIKTTAARMLRALGDPAFEKGTLGGMTTRLTALIADCGVKLVILDDIHHLIAPDTDKVVAQVSHWLKAMIKDTGVPFLVIGVEGEVERVLRSNAELSRLFAVREKLEPFIWNEKRPETIAELEQFLTLAQGIVRVEFSDELERKEWVWRMHYATEGVVSYLIQLLRAAGRRSKSSGGYMTRQELELAFGKRLARIFPHKLNPFTLEQGPRFVPPRLKAPGARRV